MFEFFLSDIIVTNTTNKVISDLSKISLISQVFKMQVL